MEEYGMAAAVPYFFCFHIANAKDQCYNKNEFGR